MAKFYVERDDQDRIISVFSTPPRGDAIIEEKEVPDPDNEGEFILVSEVVGYEAIDGIEEVEADEPPAIYVPETWDKVRAKRNALLAASDWTQLADSPLSADDKAEWAEYRQALRDLTEAESPDDVEWPDEPSV